MVNHGINTFQDKDRRKARRDYMISKDKAKYKNKNKQRGSFEHFQEDFDVDLSNDYGSES